MRNRPEDRVAVVIPLRGFAGAKARLASALDPHARAALAREMAERVVHAAGDATVVVVSSAADVAEWTTALGLTRIEDPGTLDAAADAGRAWAAANGATRVVVAHGDLPLAQSLAGVYDAADDVAIIVPDHRDDGTPVISLPVAASVAFAYGPGSATRHIDAARAANLSVRIVRDPQLAFDVDVEADLDELAASHHPIGR